MTSTNSLAANSAERARAASPKKTALRRAGDAGVGSPRTRREPETAAEAAQAFEKVLVRQFVKVMTKGMFSTSLTGEGGPGWMESQRGTQRDMMTDLLTDHLVESGALQISEKLTRQWEAAGQAPVASPLRKPPRQGLPLQNRPLDSLPVPPADANHHALPHLDRTA